MCEHLLCIMLLEKRYLVIILTCPRNNKYMYHILPNTRASPNRRAPPPQKKLDHVPEVSSPKIYMTMQFNDQFNAVLTIC